jgi:membrane associated rhomboid family serine protease
MNIIPQVAHIIMTLNILWTVYVSVTQVEFAAATMGLLIGILVFGPFIALQQGYVRTHPEKVRRLLTEVTF